MSNTNQPGAAKGDTMKRNPSTIRTAEVAHSAGRDAANRRMRKAGRMVWNKADYAAACREYARIADR